MLTYLTYADIIRPESKKAAFCYNTALILGGSLLIALCAQVSVWLPFSPVPLTGQTFAVLMVAALLGSKRGSLAVLVYLIEGASGLPVFASSRSGLAILFGPTGGYLFGFLLAAFIVGWLAEKGWDRRIWTTVAAMILGTAAIFGCGVLWLSVIVGPITAVQVGLLPFLIGEAIKIALAAAILPIGWKLLPDKKSF